MLLFADDVALISETIIKLQHIFFTFDNFCAERSLRINASKTKLMVYGPLSQTYTKDVVV